jgi:hypothetical protein
MVEMKKDCLLRDYKWLIRVIDSCKNKTHIDSAIKCYILWGKKYFKRENNHDIKFLTSLEKDAHDKLIQKSNNL